MKGYIGVNLFTKKIVFRYNIIVLIVFFGFEQILSAQIPQKGLIAYYPFNGNANDSSGNNFHGTSNNAVLTRDRFGRYECAYSLLGYSNSNIQVPTTALKNKNYSFSVWVKFKTLGESGTNSTVFEIAQGGNATGQSITLSNNYTNNNGFVGAGYNKTTTPSQWIVKAKSLPVTNRWYHIVFARGDNVQYLYVDAVLIDSFKSLNYTEPEYGNPVKAYFGIRCNGIQPLDGDIDDAALYNRVITPCEVKELYTGLNVNKRLNGLSNVILHRACLDQVTGRLEIKMTPTNDTFLNFTKYKVWGRDNSSGPFQLLQTELFRNVKVIGFLVPSKKKWEIYVSSYWETCSFGDSVNSNRIFVDDKAPDYVEPDSVSVDDATQQLIAGWTKPADADIMGYSLFKVDAQNTLIDEQNVLTYMFKKSDFDVTKAGNRLAIAGFDSCRNGGVISADHSPILLNASLSNKYQCDRKLNVSWKEYKGWLFSKHQLIIVDAVTGLKLFDTSFAPGATNYVWLLPKLGLQMKIWVRAHKQVGGITSTSNRKDLIAYDVGAPSSPTSLYYTSVENEPKIELSGFAQVGDSCVIRYREKSASTWVLGYSVATSPGNINWEFSTADAKNKEYEFRLVRFSGCGEPADSSELSGNILLRKSGNQLVWNEPQHFEKLGLVFQYEIQRFESGSWAVKGTVSSTSFEPTDLGVSTYRVRAITNNSMPMGKNWSHSNSHVFDGGYDSSLLDTFFIPDAFTPEGVNPVFKVVNQAVLPGQARMLIFNRWGEVIFDGDALEGWNGQVNGEYVSDGVYVYLINARYRSRIVKKTGTLLLIR